MIDSNIEKLNIAIIGLGYVGLPLAVEFGRVLNVVGYDIDASRTEQLNAGLDRTHECSSEEIKSAKFLQITNDKKALNNIDVFIVTVPTPVDRYKTPDMTALRDATETVAGVMSKNSIVIYESTVYPGATEEYCVPVLEKHSGLVFNQDFFCGYSPERINPGDSSHRLPDIRKVTSGSTSDTAIIVDQLYKQIITAGTHRADSIKVAEASKVIENIQRDLNIALINEFSLIFNKLGIDTLEVLQAAETKWNFLPFRPGLVGGHCIGVDPYYLTHKAKEVGYHPEVILSGRKINDSMPSHIVEQTVKLMLKSGHKVLDEKVLVLGLAFKENCPDLRNSKVVEIVKGISEYGALVDVYDPLIDNDEARSEYGIQCLKEIPKPNEYTAIILAVTHDAILSLGLNEIRSFGKSGAIFYDVKSAFPAYLSDGRL
ncbi:nucleotide sugar dehydrogenase [Amylibacter sp.]|nr:nucleotide sugar dehydrogenase [Amylibacter sp.]